MSDPEIVLCTVPVVPILYFTARFVARRYASRAIDTVAIVVLIVATGLSIPYNPSDSVRSWAALAVPFSLVTGYGVVRLAATPFGRNLHRLLGHK